MVEYPVYDDSDPVFMAEGNEMTEVFVGAQTAVGLFVISGIIAMAGGFKKGGLCKWHCSPALLYVESIIPAHQTGLSVLFRYSALGHRSYQGDTYDKKLLFHTKRS